MLEAAVTEIEHESALFFCEAFAEAEASKARSAFPVGKHKMILFALLCAGLHCSNAFGRVQGGALYWQKGKFTHCTLFAVVRRSNGSQNGILRLIQQMHRGKRIPPCAKTTHKGIFIDGVTRKYSLTLNVKKYIVVGERR